MPRVKISVRYDIIYFSIKILVFFKFLKQFNSVPEYAWDVITDFATELIEGPDKERVSIYKITHNYVYR